MNQSNSAEILNFVRQLEICDFDIVSDRVSPVCLMVIENNSVSVRENLKLKVDRDNPNGFYVRVPRVADILTAVYSPVGFKHIAVLVNDKIIYEAKDVSRGWVEGFAVCLGSYTKCEIKFTPPEYPNFSPECFKGISDIIFQSLEVKVVFLEPEDRARLFTLVGEIGSF